MAEVPAAWIRAVPASPAGAPVAAYAGDAAPIGTGPGFGKLVLTGIVATAIVMWVKGKVDEKKIEEEREHLLWETQQAARALDDEREDLSLAHDWTTAHPLALRYGQ